MQLSPTLLLMLALAVAVPAACTSTSVTNTARSGTEQLLISNAIDQSLNKVDFSAFKGSRVFLDDSFVESVDKSYLIAATRHRLLVEGAELAPTADQADVIVEMSSGGLGTDSSHAFLGIPEITVPGLLTLPEFRILTRSSQTATAKLGFVAYGPKQRQSLGDGGVTLSQSSDNNWFVLGVGPWQNGTIKTEIAKSLKQRPTNAMRNYSQPVVFRAPKADQILPPKPLQLTGSEAHTDKK